MTKQSAGTLLYRWHGDELEVLLVHPSGNYNRKSPWSIPKGEPEANESPEQAARRETLEETGAVARALESLGFINYTKSKKRVYCFGGEATPGTQPRCASWEVDKAEFLPIDLARELIHKDQAVFLDRLSTLLRSADRKSLSAKDD